jgi:hypothetical protein
MKESSSFNGMRPRETNKSVPGSEFEHRPGARRFRSANIDWRRDAALTRRRGRPRYPRGEPQPPNSVVSEFHSRGVLLNLNREGKV